MSWFSKLTGIHINVNKGTASINWNELRDSFEAGVAVIANVLYPGSGLLMTPFLSKGAQEDLRSVPGTLSMAFGSTSDGGLSSSAPVAKAGDYVGKITDSTILADATKGAIVGGVSGGAGAAISGQDIGKGALKGAEFGAASGTVGSALKGGDFRGWQLPESMRITGTGTGAQAARAGLSSFAGAEAAGQSLQSSAETGGISALATGLFPSKEGATSAQQARNQYERQLFQQGLSQALANSREKQPVTAPPQTTISGQGQQPSTGTAALAQALRVGDAGGPIFGSSGEEKGKKPSGWNIESLRYMGSEA